MGQMDKGCIKKQTKQRKKNKNNRLQKWKRAGSADLVRFGEISEWFVDCYLYADVQKRRFQGKEYGESPD